MGEKKTGWAGRAALLAGWLLGAALATVALTLARVLDAPDEAPAVTADRPSGSTPTRDGS